MADVQIASGAYTEQHRQPSRGGIFWKSTTVGYCFYLDAASDLVYQKTTDGGATWGGEVDVTTNNVVCYNCWADWQTPGDAGVKIHIAYIETDGDDITYDALDTSDDTLDGAVDIITPASGIATNREKYYHTISITKSRGGKLGVACRWATVTTLANNNAFYTSPDGTTWTSKTSLFDQGDFGFLWPANLADSNDIWCVWYDYSSGAFNISTYDDSANSWSTTAIGGYSANPIYYQFDGAIRQSDGHLILAFWSQYDNAAADLLVKDINGASSITAKTNVITDEAESFGCAVFINPVNDDIYVAYMSGSAAAATVKCFYQKSTDGGANWGGETAMQADAEDDIRWVSAGAMKATLGGKFQPIWFNDDFNDIFTNTDNGITINASAGGETHALAATMTGACVMVAAVTLISILSATLSGIGTMSSLATLTSLLAATLAGAGALAGVITRKRNLAGTLSASAILSSVLTRVRTASGVLSGAGAMSGKLAGRYLLRANMAASASLSGVMAIKRQLTAVLAGAGEMSAALCRKYLMRADYAGTGILSGALKATRTLAADLAGSATLAGSLKLTRTLIAGMSGSGAMVSSLTRKATLAGIMSGSGNLIASLTEIAPYIYHYLAGAMSGAGTLGAILTRPRSLVASFIGTGSMGARLYEGGFKSIYWWWIKKRRRR